MAEGIQIKNLPSTTAIKHGDTMTIVQDKQNKQLSLDVFANESDLATLSPLENRCDEVKAKIEVDEYSAEITTSQSISKIGSDDSGVNLHENVLDGAFESCVLKGKTKYRDIDTGEILEDFEEGRNLELITVRMPILTTFNQENLFLKYSHNKNDYNCTTNSIIQQQNGNSVKITGGGSLCYSRFVNNQNLPYGTYKFSCKVKVGAVGDKYKILIHRTPNDAANNNDGFVSEQLTSTKEVTNFEYVGYFRNANYMLFYTFYNGQEIEYYDIMFTKISDDNVVEDYKANPQKYEYKTSILSLPEEVVLRSLPDGTCDTLNVETGEYVQKIGERSYQNDDTNSNTLVTDGTKTQYKLSSPITTKVDVQGFPHSYKNGHIQLSSGSIEPSLTPTVTYKVPVSRVGQIASNTKSNLRQTIKLDQLEILTYQSLINTEYENLLVQNSAESAASFTNLSTNDPKDGLYYMLKHLIEEDQPVQNMLDKINLFYLYGLLSDEHYFDLLLGGEEDVY